MKRIFLAVVIAFSITMAAQTKSKKSAVPTVVKQAFAKEFPSKKATWSTEDKGFEAEFNMNDTGASAVYDKNGHRKELETEIKINELPANAVTYIKANYPTSRIAEVAKITDDKNVITYEAEIKKGRKAYDVLFDNKGQFIKILENNK